EVVDMDDLRTYITDPVVAPYLVVAGIRHGYGTCRITGVPVVTGIAGVGGKNGVLTGYSGTLNGEWKVEFPGPVRDHVVREINVHDLVSRRIELLDGHDLVGGNDPAPVDQLVAIGQPLEIAHKLAVQQGSVDELPVECGCSGRRIEYEF